MITALEAKINAFKKRPHYKMVEQRIVDASSAGDMMCTFHLEEIPNGTLGLLYEISSLLNELGYQTTIEDQDTLYVCWYLKRPMCYNVDGSDNEEE